VEKLSKYTRNECKIWENYTRNEWGTFKLNLRTFFGKSRWFWNRLLKYTRNEWRKCETTLQTSGEDVWPSLLSSGVFVGPPPIKLNSSKSTLETSGEDEKLHSKRVKKIMKPAPFVFGVSSELPINAIKEASISWPRGPENYTPNEWRRCENYTRNEWRRLKNYTRNEWGRRRPLLLSLVSLCFRTFSTLLGSSSLFFTLVLSVVFTSSQLVSSVVFTSSQLVSSVVFTSSQLVSSVVFTSSQLVSSVVFTSSQLVSSVVFTSSQLASSVVFTSSPLVSSVVSIYLFRFWR
jgi:hypothetical protein